MNNNEVKLSDVEIKEINKIQDNFQQLTYEFGRLSMQKIQLVDYEERLKEEWLKLKKIESDFINGLLTKYGEGSLDLKSGVFISEIDVDKKK